MKTAIKVALVLVFMLGIAKGIVAGEKKALEGVKTLYLKGESPLTVNVKQTMQKDVSRTTKWEQKGRTKDVPCFDLSDDEKKADATVEFVEAAPTSHSTESPISGRGSTVSESLTLVVRDATGRVLLEKVETVDDLDPTPITAELYHSAGCSIIGQRKTKKPN